MNYNVIDEAILINTQHEYCVKVTTRENGYLVVSYPEKILRKPFLKPLVVIYYKTEDGVKKTVSDTTKVFNFQCPDYSYRIITACDIMIESSHRGLHDLLISCDTEDIACGLDIMEVIKPPIDIEKEKKLEVALINSLSGRPVDDEEIEDGVDRLNYLINVGGF